MNSFPLNNRPEQPGGRVVSRALSVVLLLDMALSRDYYLAFFRNSSFTYVTVVTVYFLLTIIAVVGLIRFRVWGFHAIYLLVPFSTLLLSDPLIPLLTNLLPTLTLRIWSMVALNVLILLAAAYAHFGFRRSWRVQNAAVLHVLLAAAALSAALAAPARSQEVAAGYRVVVADQALDLTLRQDAPSPFHAIVVRRAGSDAEMRLLRLAESLYPSAERIGDPPSCDGANPPRNPWWTSCSAVVPFAITAGAVRFYLDRIEALRGGEQPPMSAPLRSGHMRYEASIARETEVIVDGRRYADVFVARLRLEWWVQCGEPCGWGFEKERTVVMSPTGDVLGVTGDGRTPVRVS